MMKTLLAFGDSNTHGTQPMPQKGTYGRFDQATRWTGVLQNRLGPDWQVIDEGLPGRTTGMVDPVMGQHMNGQDGLRIALGSHVPIDHLLIMLGTNDLKTRFNPSPAKITAGVAGLLDIALHPDTQAAHDGFSVVLICPPPVKERGCLAGEFYGAEQVVPHFPPLFSALAAAKGASFFDAGAVIACSEIDGVHFDADAHHALGLALASAPGGQS